MYKYQHPYRDVGDRDLLSTQVMHPFFEGVLTNPGRARSLTELLDRLETEVKPAAYQAGQEKVDELAKRISARIQQVIGINVPVIILPHESIERSVGKAKRIIDER